MDYTPELKRRATEILSRFRIGGLYVPPLPYPHKNSFINNVGCVGGLNIYHPPVADPATGLMFVPHARSCVGADLSRADRRQGRGAHRVGRQERRSLARPRARDAHHRHDRGGVEAGRTDDRLLPLIDGLPVYKPLLPGPRPRTT